jgi:hypothetical protein
MGADRFIAFYGLRFEIKDDEAGEVAIEEGNDPRLLAATNSKLHTYTGRMSDGEPVFILIGASLGCFGYQDKFQHSLSDTELTTIANSVRQRLKEAGFTEEPCLWFQFEGQY